MGSLKFRSVMFSAISISAAFILLSSILIVGSTGSSVGALPGKSLSESSFAELGNDSLGSTEPRFYPPTYVVMSEEPFIIEVDYQDALLIPEQEAESVAQRFIDSVIAHELSQQLDIDRRSALIWGALPKWTINFRNNTYSIPISIEAKVTVNAISGAVIGYSGLPILCHGEIDNQSTAEYYALSALKYLDYQIPSNSRLTSTNKTDTNDRIITYRFVFQQVSNDVLIDTGIGALTIELDASTGGVQFLSMDWIQIDQISTENVLPSERVSSDAVLSLIRVSATSFNDLVPQELQLCYVMQDWWSGSILLLDPLTGDLIDERESFSVPHSLEFTGWRFLAPILVSSVPAAFLYLWIRRTLRKSL